MKRLFLAMIRHCGFMVLAMFCIAGGRAYAGPWTDVGDSQLRSDIEVLAAAGVIDNITTQWPLPWGGLLYRLQQPGALDGQSSYVREAAARVERMGLAQTAPDHTHISVSIDAATSPEIVRAFDAMDRETAQTQASIAWNGETTALRLSVGAQTNNRFDRQTLMFDDSYIAQEIGNSVLYAGYMTHWWGPGWISAVSLSNNARPIPQIGISRVDTTGFDLPVLSWLGPWQAEFFVGVLDGDRIASNTLLDGLRFAFNPLPGLEIGIARTDEFCGTGHPCKPLATYFDLQNNPSHPSRTNDEGNIDIKYSGSIFGQISSIYMQLMNEDTSPVVHSGTSHLFGATNWIPVGQTRIRLTTEYTDSIATRNVFSFGEDIYGFSYHDGKYVDGMRYRDRTLGFSLDGDSRLATLQASWIGGGAIVYTLTYDRAMIGSDQSLGTNIVSPIPVSIDIGEARVEIPFRQFIFDIDLRAQDDQPRPDHGATGAAELRIRYSL